MPSWQARRNVAHPTAGNSGLVRTVRNQRTGALVSVYNAVEAGLDPDGGDWCVVCETHGAILNRDTKTSALHFMHAPWNHCEDCRERLEGGA